LTNVLTVLPLRYSIVRPTTVLLGDGHPTSLSLQDVFRDLSYKEK